MATVVNGRVPAPLLRWREGDTVTLRVANRLLARSSIHWHGTIVPADMDGVPGLSFPGIPGVREQGWSATLADRRMWGQMRMDPTDLLDVSGYAYTYLMNGFAPAGNWTGLFARGEKVRLRFINGSSMSFFDVRIPGLKLTVIAADGQDVDR